MASEGGEDTMAWLRDELEEELENHMAADFGETQKYHDGYTQQADEDTWIYSSYFSSFLFRV